MQNNNDWIPVSSNVFPEENVDVQVTYLSYNTNEPLCNSFAYYDNGKWYWTEDDSEVLVIITAWKENCEPYRGD